MNIKKIVMSVVLVVGLAHGGNLEPIIADCTDMGKMVSGGIWINTKSGNKVDRKNVCRIGIRENKYYYKKDPSRVEVKQIKNPCFFVDKEDWELDKGKKINSNTIAFNYGVDVQVNTYDYFGDETRPDLGHNLVFHKNGKITNKKDGREILQILGKSNQCYLHPTVEEWSFYNGKKRDNFVGKVTFYLK